jgi:acyl-CoA synthetase (AMP-forming)/AMP-acid ligase II
VTAPTCSPTPRDMWRARVEATPDRTFLRCGDRTWTFAELDLAARRLARSLADRGVEPGTRVAVGMSNRAETVTVQRALEQLGAVIVPILPGLALDEVLYQLNHCRARHGLFDDPVAALLEGALDRCPHLVDVHLAGDLEPMLGADPLELLPLPGYDDCSLWSMLYTSGSTGRPKAVMLPAGSFLTGGSGYAERYGVRADDNFLLATPLGHAVGALTAQSIAIHKGCELTLLDRFSPSRWWDDVKRHEGTFSVLFPAQLNLLVRLGEAAPAPGETSFRLAITHTWHEAFRRRFGVELGICWAMTETGGIGAGSETGYDGSRDAGYIGAPWPATEIGTFDPGGRRLAAGEQGELRLRHRHVMLGYLDNPTATAETLTDDGWIRSGDAAVIDPDGHLVFRGRLKNVIKRAGENIGAEEVETVLDSLPGVAESLVFGVADDLRTEEIFAVVVLEAGAEAAAVEFHGGASAALARWKVPRYLAITRQPLPRLANGKPDRRAVEAATDTSRAWDHDSAG